MKVRIEEGLCVNCGTCQEQCPDIFKDGFNTATLRISKVPRDMQEECREVADLCPCEAIKVEE